MYHYHEIKVNGTLPVDVNRPVESKLLVLKDDELNKKLEEIRVRRLHGTLDIYDSRGINFFTANAKDGVIPRYLSHEISAVGALQRPFVVIFKRSEFNSNIRMGGGKEHDNENS